jgi:hypothetical protein
MDHPHEKAGCRVELLPNPPASEFPVKLVCESGYLNKNRLLSPWRYIHPVNPAQKKGVESHAKVC